MLSKEQLRYDQLYAYRAGMLNNAWIAGVARFIKKREGYIQQTNNLNHMIPFMLDEGDSMPSWVKDGVPLKINARLHSARDGQDTVVILRAIGFEHPSIIDMPPREWFDFQVKQGVPTEQVPIADAPDRSMKFEGFKVADTGNMVRVAGFVSGFVIEPAGSLQSDGSTSNGCVILSLRQTRDPDDVVPIRCYGGKADVLGRRLDIGFPIYVEGKLRMRVKETGEPAGPDGIIPTRKLLYVHTNILNVANPGSHIQIEPTWAKEMALEHRSKRQQVREQTNTRRTASREDRVFTMADKKAQQANSNAGEPSTVHTEEASSGLVEPAITGMINADELADISRLLDN